MKKILLIDGHSILNRAFFGVPDLTNAEGLHTNAVYGFLNILFKILDEEEPEYLTVAFDRSEPTFRHQRYADYKGTRKPMAEELRQQIPVMKEVLHAMGIKTVEQAGLEADDLLGTMAARAEAAGFAVRILSGDRDLLQLATEQVQIRIPKTKKTGTEIENYFAADVLARYQVTPKEFIDVKALMGDVSDNIPGVAGIGEKGATAIISTYKSIENAYAHVEEIKPKRAQSALAEHYDLARLSKELATIETNAPMDFDLESAKIDNFYTPAAYEWFRRLEFKQMLLRFDHKPETKKELPFLVLDRGEEAKARFAAYQAGQTAIHLLWEEGVLFGAAIANADEETVVYCRCGGEFSRQELAETLAQVIAGSALVISPDIKLLLKLVPMAATTPVMDTTLAAYLLNPLKSEYAYDDLARDFLGETLPSRVDLLGKRKPQKAALEKPEALVFLACYGAYVALRVREALLLALEKQGMDELYGQVELPLVFVLDSMEKEGILVDRDALWAYGQQLADRLAQLEESIYQLAGEQFNINSPKQLGIILFEKLGLPGGKKTKTGYSTAADVLEKLAVDHPIVSEILEYRQLAKLKSTYADGLQGCIDEDGRIHTTFNQTIAATGRLSSAEPNLQNIPIRMELGRLIRRVFIPREGFVFLDADYSQIELRVLAHLSADENLIAAYRHADDIHRITASQVFHVPLEEVTPLQRRNAKAVNFGIVYGISSFGLSQGLSITRKEAEGYIQRYFATFPGIKAHLDWMVADAREKGVATTLFGRQRPVPELSSGNFMQRQFGERIAMNSPIQGTAADIIKIAMIRVDRRLKEEGLSSRLILQVHDELLVETAREEIPRVKQILTEEMHGAAALSVPLEIDLQEGTTWYDAH